MRKNSISVYTYENVGERKFPSDVTAPRPLQLVHLSVTFRALARALLTADSRGD